MAQKKGQTGNPNGRPKGTPNKVTKDVRQLLNDIVQSNIINIDNDLKKLTSKERLQIITGLLPYVVPKKTELEFSNDTPGITLNFNKTALSQKDIELIREIENGSIPIEAWVNPDINISIN